MDFVPSSAKTIIVAPLNWGLGHATRCIPIIRALLSHNKKVILASDGEALELLQQEFPQLTSETLPPYKVRYNSESLAKIVASNSLNIASAIQLEKKVARQLVKKQAVDLIISDSRFGFRDASIRNIIISHQLNPQASNPLLKSLLEKGNRYYLNQFDECWIPDTDDRRLSGILSRSSHVKNQRFIGPLSALKFDVKKDTKVLHDLAIILSGPEPARTKLESELTGVLRNNEKSICLVRGTSATSTITHPSHWVVHNRIGSADITEILTSSKHILSRSGYTSIMDYARLGVGAYLIPTPGQTEQEYLAQYLDGRDGFVWLKDIDSIKAI